MRNIFRQLVALISMGLLVGCSSGAGSVKEAINYKEEDMRTIYLAGGCFWGVEKFFAQFEGVADTEVGYANGPETYRLSYREVCNGSGHAETVKVTYDESRMSMTDLLNYYFMVIDPTSVNKQGNDVGIQYRTGIYYTDDSQLEEIRAVYDEQEKKIGQPLAVELEPLRNFYPAEDYHQDYLEKNPGGYCHIPSSMFKLEQERKKDEAKELRNRIGDLSYEVTQNAATERAFTGEYDEMENEGYGEYKRFVE